MTDEERRYKVLEIEKYRDQIRSEEDELMDKTRLAAGLAICLVSSSIMVDSVVGQITFGALTVGVGAAMGSIANSFIRQTVAEKKISKIESELEKDEQRGKSL